MERSDPSSLYDRLGKAGFDRLTRAFYRRVSADPILGPMYPADDLEGARLRLRDFLIYRFGGPATYIERRGHPRLRARHLPFAIDQAARDRWIALMDCAIDDADLPSDAADALRQFFGPTATFMINRPPGPPGE